MQHHCSACEMEIGLKAPGSAKHLKLFVHTSANHPKSSVKAGSDPSRHHFKSGPYSTADTFSTAFFVPCCPPSQQPLTCCCLYHTRPQWHITSTSCSAEGGRSSTEEHNSGNEHMGHLQACLQCPPLVCSVLQKPHLPQSTRKGESTAASTFSNGT